MMFGIARRATLVGILLLLSGALGTAGAIPGAPPAPAGGSSDPGLQSPGLGSAAEGQKPEAGGRVIRR